MTSITTPRSGREWCYVVLALLCLLPQVSAPYALVAGIAFALISKSGNPYPKFNKKASKLLLQISVVGLGFGMNLHEALRSGMDGIGFTLVSVTGVMLIGILLGRALKLDRSITYLISGGTAICGGSAIAAIGPVMRTNDSQMSVSLATIFLLNSIALLLFPPLGHWLGLSQEQFGTWAAIAIHDTSSVVGAGSAYGEQALQIATTIKLTRALWIIPLSLFTAFYFKSPGRGVSIPWFIVLFVVAMCITTYLHLPSTLTSSIFWLSKRALVLTLFFIGAGLSRSAIKTVGWRPMALGILLWIFISLASLAFVCYL